MSSSPNRGGRSPGPPHLSEPVVARFLPRCLKLRERPALMGRWALKLPPDESEDHPPPRTGQTELHRGCGPGHLFRDVAVYDVDRLFRPPDLEPQTATRLAARSHPGIPALAARVLRLLLLARIVRAWFQAVPLPMHSPAAPARRQRYAGCNGAAAGPLLPASEPFLRRVRRSRIHLRIFGL